MKQLALMIIIFISIATVYGQTETTDEDKNTGLEEQKTQEDGNSETTPRSFTIDPSSSEEELVEEQSEEISEDDSADAEAVVEEDELTIEEEVVTTAAVTHKAHSSNDDIQTLAGGSNHNGGFGALSFKSTEFNNKDIVMMGIRGGWIINRAVSIGFEGYGVIPTAEYENIDPDRPVSSRAVGGYGGMFIEPIVFSNTIVHLTFPVGGGAGLMGYVVDWENNNVSSGDDLIDGDVFWYVEPGASIELNVARSFRMNFGASYRFTQDLKLMNTSDDAFNAWNYFITLKFGRF